MTATVPLPEEKQGRFTGRPIYDPYTTYRDEATGKYMRNPFPGNIIPESRMDPVGRSVVQRYPDPNLPGRARNYLRAPVEATRGHNATFRGDVNLSDVDNMFGRYSFNVPDFRKDAALPEPAATGVVRKNHASSIGYGYTRTISPTVVNEFRFGWNEVSVDQDGVLPRDEIVPGALAPDVTTLFWSRTIRSLAS